MRNKLIFPCGKDLGFRFFVVLFLIFSIFLIKTGDFARSAAGDVTLTASAFSDTDTEDTQNASQWVIRDSGSTVYDQVAGAVNTITVPAATFSNGTTYFWKVRYQDQHLVWGDYSAESSFVYGTAATPTPTGTSTTTATATVSGTSTSTTTATATVTSSPSKTPYPSPSPTPTATCMFGWALVNGDWFCGDPSPLASNILVNEDLTDFCPSNMVKITYYWAHDDSFSGGWGNMLKLQDYIDLMKGPDAPIHDIYLSTDGGSVYKRIEHDFDPMPGAVMEKLPSEVKGRGYPWPAEVLRLKVTHYVKIPEGTISDSAKAKILVYIAHNRTPIDYGSLPEGTMYLDDGGRNLGDSFLFSGSSDYWLGADVMDFTNGATAKDCGNISPTISPVDNQCKSTITSPLTWAAGKVNRVAWASGFEVKPGEERTMSLYVDSGKSLEPVALSQPDTGSFDAEANIGSAKTVNLKLEQFLSGRLASSCTVKLNTGSGGGKGGCSGSGCVPRTLETVLVLGSLISTLLSLLLTGLSAFPALSRVLSGLFNLLSAPVWPGAGWPSGRHSWGTVYDTSSKTPVEKALIRVFSEPGGRLRTTIKTNKNGQFGFILPPGVYSIAVSHSGYDFPTRLINAQTDGPYANLYKGGNFKVEGDGSEKAQINFNVPIDRVKVSSFDLVELKILTTVSKFFQAIRMPLMILGSASVAYLIFTQARTLDYVLAVIYVLMWAWEIRNMLKKRAFGLVRDQQGNPVSLVMIRVLDRYNRLKTTIVTGDDGKFQANLDPGEYRFDISRPGYKSIRTQMIQISGAQDIGRLDLNLTKL